MGVYVEEVLVLDTDLHIRSRELVVYRQPAWRHHTGRVLQALTLRTRPIERIIEAALRRWRPVPPEDLDTHIPFGPALDLWVFDFTNKDRTELYSMPAQ